jgi:S1-C subfamily serine protease
MSNRSKVFASLTFAALLAVATNAGAAEQDSKSADKDAKSQAELERKLADARKRLDEAAREVANLSISLSDDMVPRVGTFGRVMEGPPRAVLGINLMNGDVKGDGVEVVSVSPGGAAERAGLKAGDVLTEINGKALKSSDDESARNELLGAMRKVKPGDTVAVSYRRDNKVVKANLVAQPLQDHFFQMAIPPGAPGLGPMPRMPNFVFMRGEGVFGSAELVPMTPKLGQYFGTDTGLLVVRAPDDSRLKLEDGDVIVDIDGRIPSSPSHALRILSSYQPGEKLKLNILRTKKRMSFEVTVPEDAWEKRFDGARFERGLRYAPEGVIEAMPVMPGVPGIRVEGPGPVTLPAPPLPDEPV